MRVVVYVEGPSDQYTLEVLLAPLLEKKRQRVTIHFIQSPEGDRKKTLLTKVPAKAANTLLNDPASMVAVVPDLYPRNKAFPHETFNELQAGIMACPDGLARRLGVSRVAPSWDTPVEDQNHGLPPKRVVEQLFRSHDSVYKDTTDAPVIMNGQGYTAVASACPRCFKPFVDFLESL